MPPTFQTIERTRNRIPVCVKELNPLDYKPFEAGDEIAKIVFFNVPYVTLVETEDVAIR